MDATIAPRGSAELNDWLYKLEDQREQENVEEARRLSTAFNEQMCEQYIAGSIAMRDDTVPAARPSSTPVCAPALPAMREGGYHRRDVDFGRVCEDGPGTEKMVEELVVGLVERDGRWSGEGGIEKVNWLVEHASVTEGQAREALCAADLVLADAYQALVLA